MMSFDLSPFNFSGLVTVTFSLPTFVPGFNREFVPEKSRDIVVLLWDTKKRLYQFWSSEAVVQIRLSRMCRSVNLY